MKMQITPGRLIRAAILLGDTSTVAVNKWGIIIAAKETHVMAKRTRRVLPASFLSGPFDNKSQQHRSNAVTTKRNEKRGATPKFVFCSFSRTLSMMP
jgi:hypothetical protein